MSQCGHGRPSSGLPSLSLKAKDPPSCLPASVRVNENVLVAPSLCLGEGEQKTIVNKSRTLIPLIPRLFIMIWRRRLSSLQGDHSGCGEPPVDFKTEVPLWPGLSWSDQAKTELLF